MTEAEEWRDVPGYEGRYEVSDKGRVRSLPRPKVRASRILRTPTDAAGYPTVHLWGSDGKSTTIRVHNLILLAFVGPPPVGVECVRHLDGDHERSVLSNLRYGTASENMHDRVRHGTHHEAAKTHCVNGHPFDDVNTYRIPSRPNSRFCRACQAAARNRRRARQRAEGLPVT